MYETTTTAKTFSDRDETDVVVVIAAANTVVVVVGVGSAAVNSSVTAIDWKLSLSYLRVSASASTGLSRYNLAGWLAGNKRRRLKIAFHTYT